MIKTFKNFSDNCFYTAPKIKKDISYMANTLYPNMNSKISFPSSPIDMYNTKKLFNIRVVKLHTNLILTIERTYDRI